MKRSPSPQTLKDPITENNQHKRSASADQGHPNNDVFYNYQSGNNQLTMLFSPLLLPHPSISWPTLSAKTVVTPERLGLGCFGTVLLSAHCAASNIAKLGQPGRKILPRPQLRKGKRSGKQVLFLQDRELSPASL